MFIDADRERLRAIFDSPDDDVARLVLADTLLERGEALGELIRLQVNPGSHADARGEALLDELRPRIKQALYPSARHVALERGLPCAAELDPEKIIRALQQGNPVDPAWPLRRVSMVGNAAGTIYAALKAPLFEFVERLELNQSRFWSQYTQFVDGTPAPARALPRLRFLSVPRDALPPHWAPVLGPAFVNVQVLTVPASGELGPWLPLLPKLQVLDLHVDGRGLEPALRREAEAFIARDARRTLRINGMEVSVANLDRALPAPQLGIDLLAHVAVPPVGRAERVEVHAVLVPELPLVDATLDGERGVWLELPSRRTSFRGQVGQRQDVRLAMLAPLHPNVAGGRRVVENDAHTWLRLDDGLTPFPRPRTPEGAALAAKQLAQAFEVLRDYLRDSGANVSWPWPLSQGELLQRPDGTLAVLPPRPHHFPTKRSQPSLGVPVSSSDRDLVLFVGWVLAQWLGVRLPPLGETNDTDVLYEQSVALDRFLEAPRVELELPVAMKRVLEGCWSPRQAERFPNLGALIAALTPGA